DVAPAQADRAGVGRERARQQVHQRRLARTVRADQRVPRALVEREIHAVGDDERSEGLAQALRLEHHRSGSRCPRIFSTTPASCPPPCDLRTSACIDATRPPRKNSTTTISSSPMPKDQNPGLIFASRSSSSMYSGTPTIAPYRRPVPPNTSITSAVPERSKPSRFSVTKALYCA